MPFIGPGWGPVVGGSAAASVNAVRFDGTNDRLDGAVFAADGDVVSGSIFARRTRSGQVEKLISGQANRFNVYFRADDKFEAIFWDGGALTNVTVDSSAITDTNWHHFGFMLENANSTGGASGNGVLFVDGVDDTTIPTNTISTNSFNLNRAFSVGANQGLLTEMFDGDIAADLWLTNEKIDWATEIDKFYNGGNPVYTGDTGETPTGTQSVLCLRNAAATFHQNFGSHADLTPVGSLDDATGPGPYS